MSKLRPILTAALTLASALFVADSAFGSPMAPSPLTVTDKSGRSFEVLLHGDEFLSWMSDLKGYPVERSEDGAFHYLRALPDGTWEHTDLSPAFDSPEENGLTAYPPMDAGRLQRGMALRQQFRAAHTDKSAQTKAVSPQKPKGKLHALVIPMSFPDLKLTRTTEEFQALFDGPVRDYYLEVSGGALDLTATVVSPLAMQNYTASYYAWNSAHPTRPAWKLYEAAFNYLDGKNFDFKPFDKNGDGYADLVIIIHAGKGREQTGNDDDMHSHFMPMSNLAGYPEYYTSHDGVKLFGYVMVPENAKLGDITPLGVIVHESGHYFGLPDLYQTGASDTGEGLGEFCLMSSGMWLGPKAGTSPSHPSAWCKSELGWLTPEKLTRAASVALPPIQTSAGKVLRVDTDDDARDPNQYFLLENRPKMGFDSYLPGAGLLIYHVDEGVFPSPNGRDQFMYNQAPDHYGIDLEQADGLRQLNTSGNRGDANDPWPTSKHADFTPTTTPSSLAYGAETGKIAITNIRKTSDSILFDFAASSPLALGESCQRDAQCQSGICAGECCEDNCSGMCGGVCASSRSECPLPSGIACDDGDPCTENDMCSGGTCRGTPRSCIDGTNSCVLSSFCDSISGRCFSNVADDGSPCESPESADGDEFCMGGQTGFCEAGTCRLPTLMNGQKCSDGNACTEGDTCSSGRCVPGKLKTCTPPDECHLAGTCDPDSGTCSVIPAFEGTPCGSGGQCQAGVCVRDKKASGCSSLPGGHSGGTDSGRFLDISILAGLLALCLRRVRTPKRQ